MTACPLSLRELTPGESFDRDAAVRLFGVAQLPSIDVELAKLQSVALAMIGTTTLSGAQRKLSVGLDTARMTLRVSAAGRQFILKPPTDRFAHLPANEHVTMRLAALAGLTVPEHGLLALADGALAYLVARFDRPPNGGKLAVEDFCSLALRHPADKYSGSAELCARIVRRFASEPALALRDLFRQFLFAWWSGNGDLHLKNLALWRDREGQVGLSPAFDLVNTRLLLPADRLALTIGGKSDHLTIGDWRKFGAYCGLSSRVTSDVATSIAYAAKEAPGLIARSFLPEADKAAYVALLAERGQVVSALVQ